MSPSEIGDRLAIMDLLARYTRGVDRCDLDVLAGVFAQGGTVDLGSGAQDALSWATAMMDNLPRFRRTQHMLGQTIIDLHGDTASTETYCRAYHELDGDGGSQEISVAGRYLDALVRTAAGWRIRHRRYVMDWNRNCASGSQSEGGLYDLLQRRSARKPDDPLYTGA